jgi:outer membrane protein OmpA-like peptidoglycan-associated protein/uncharacterized surface protein with fasciclin (FAS1) repeats
MPTPPRLSSPRYRHRILAAGLIAAGALFSFVAPVYIGRIEDDLAARVPEELAEAGFDGVAAEFSGQDGTLRCDRPLTDPEAATAAAYDVWGVRAITLDRSCRVNVVPGVDGDDASADSTLESAGDSNVDSAGDASGESTAVSALASAAATGTESAGSATSTAEYATLADLIADDPRFSYLSVLLDESGITTAFDDPSAEPVTIFAPTDSAFERLSADANAHLRSQPALLAELLDHHMASGVLLADEIETGPLSMLDGTSVDVDRVGSAITIDGSRLVDVDLTAGNGVVHAIDGVLVPDDLDLTAPPGSVPVTTDAGAVTTAVATTSSATSPEQAAALTVELNEYVAANPLRFAAGQAVLSPESAPVLDLLAARLLEVPGISVTIEGHTDSDGSPDRNLTLSRQRAEAVLLALVARGVTAVPLTATGYGSQRPVLVNGVEDKDASRRVEFLVEAAA